MPVVLASYILIWLGLMMTGHTMDYAFAGAAVYLVCGPIAILFFAILFKWMMEVLVAFAELASGLFSLLGAVARVFSPAKKV